MATLDLKAVYKELKEDCKIDKNALDEECCKQAFLYTKWSKRLAQAEANFRRVELELTQHKATTMVAEKENKKTDKIAESTYRMSSTYGSISRKKSILKKTADLMQSGVYSMMQRKSMLEALVKLKTADYY
jgi:hypothetical protein